MSRSIALGQIVRAKSAREQGADGDINPLWPIADRNHLDVGSEFMDDLPARSTWGRGCLGRRVDHHAFQLELFFS